MLYNEYLNKDLLTPADVTHLLRRSAICFSLHNSKKSFSSALDQTFFFSFVGLLILTRSKKQISSWQFRETKTRCNLSTIFSLPVPDWHAKLFLPNFNACVRCIRVLYKTRRTFIRNFSCLSEDASYFRRNVPFTREACVSFSLV